MPRRQYVLAEDALTVLIDSFGYEVFSFGDSTVVLTKGKDRRRRIINLPYNVERIPADQLRRVLARADFTVPEFWAALESYLRS